MTNLVILYSGNVGSTPLIQIAARFAPVREARSLMAPTRQHPSQGGQP